MSAPQVTSSEAAGAAPRSIWLVLIVLATLGPPLLLRALGTGVGSFSMFTQPIRYHLRIVLEQRDGKLEPFPVRQLDGHLGRDARRIVLPAQDWFVGETHAELVAGGLVDLGALVCRLTPARAVNVVLDRDDISHHRMIGQVARVPCP